jgi:hypothetical protein
MKNEIQIMPVNDIMIMAKTFAESGMFADAKAMGQAFVKIQAGQEIGIPPFAAMSGIHIIQGKPTIGAGLIASAIKGSGKYDYKVIEMTEKNCSIDFYQGKEMIGNSSFSIEDAKKALTKNIDKFPKNMLFARAISNGVKWFTPDVFSGPVYTPEEIGCIEEQAQDIPPEVIEQPQDIPHEVIEQPKKPIKLSQVAIDKLVTIEEIEKYLNLVEEGAVTMTQVQVLNLEDKLTELRNL